MALDVHAHKSLIISKITLMRFDRNSANSAREAETCLSEHYTSILTPGRVFTVILNSVRLNT
jgi:hypothetical protein